MTAQGDSNSDQQEVTIPRFPEVVIGGVTTLVACNFPPADHAVILHALCQSGRSEDTAIVVTTTHSAVDTRAAFASVCPASLPRSLSLVDTASEQQYISAVYTESRVVYTPPDVERLVMGLVEITDMARPDAGTRSLGVRSLSPLLRENSIDAVGNMITRISGLRSEAGSSFFGIDYTQHDQATMAHFVRHVDYVLWVSMDEGGRLRFELESSRSRRRLPES